MVTDYGLREVWIPQDEDLPEEKRLKPKANIFMSEDFYDPGKQDRRIKNALVLIQGTGQVRAG
jgi:hypothetical protein